MSASSGINAATIETTGLQVLILLAAVIYGCIFLYLIWAASSADQRLKSTSYRRGKFSEVKTSQSKPKKSTSTAAVQLKDNNIKDTNTARLQICDSFKPKSDTVVHNIKSETNQKMEHRMQEENFITVLSKRQRQRIHREKIQQEKKEKEQQLEEKQAREKQNQSNKRRHEKPLQQEIVTPTTNKTTAKSSKAKVVPNEQPSWESCQFIDQKSKVNITKKLLCVENDSSLQSLQTNSDKVLNAERDVQELQVKHSTMTKASYTNFENLLQAASQSAQVSQDVVIEMTRIEDYTLNRDSVKNNKHLKRFEIETIEIKDNRENEKRCKEHDTTIKDLREENENMRMQNESLMKNNWTDSEFKIVLEGVRAEIEMKGLDAIKKLLADHQAMLEELKMEHDVEIKGLHLYYQSMLSNLQMEHDMTVGNIHMEHQILINGFRNFNYEQSQRYETAIQSMREVKDKMSKEHQKEVRDLREKYENTIKDHEIVTRDLMEEKELLRAEYEKVVRELHERNEDQHHTTIETQITNSCDDNDVDTTTTTIAEDDAIDMLQAQNSVLNETVVDYKQIFYDTEQKLIQLHGYTSNNDSDCPVEDVQ